MGDALSDVKDLIKPSKKGEGSKKFLEPALENSKFSCPVSMKVTQEQYEKDLKQTLLDLGYYVTSYPYNSDLLATNWAGMVSKATWFYYYEDGTRNAHNRYFIDHYNPELFLALAGMREGDQIHVGEFMMGIDDGQLLKITSVDVKDDLSIGAFSSNYVQECWRKATKKEIIDFFTKPLEEMPDLGSGYANDVVKGLLSEIENLKKENDELKGHTRMRRGYVDPYNKSDLPSLGEIKIREYPLTPEECYKVKDGTWYHCNGAEPHSPLKEALRETMGSEGYKESENKLSYELDWNFIEAMAKRMASNKDKYEPYNWTKPLHLQKLKEPLTRHFIEVMKGNYDEDGMENAHLFSIALNCMMINYQLKHNKIDE